MAFEALAISRDYALRIDLLLCNEEIGEILGSELAEALLAARPEIRVVLISGSGESSPFPVLSKPFTIEQVQAKVHEILDGRPQSRNTEVSGFHPAA
jgi:hypothetical protein